MKPLRAFVASTVVLACLGACSDADTLLRPVHRFVDEEGRTAGGRLPATATILDETRFVLQGFVQGEIMRTWGAALTSESHLSLRPNLPDRFEGASRIVVRLLYRSRSVSRQEALTSGPQWKTLPPKVARVVAGPRRNFVELEFDFPEALAGSEIDIAAIGFAPSEDSRQSHQTAEVEVPLGTQLEFGIGILEPAEGQGPVTFSVEACRAGNCAPVFSETLDPADSAERGWQDRSLTLDELANAKVSFRFEAALRREEPGSFSFPVWSNPTLYAPAPRSVADMNLILLSVDTLRADHLTSYGYALDTAPFAHQKFAKGGTLFENLVAAAATTVPSHMTIFTSMQPSVHKVLSGGGILSPAAITLAEALRAHGFTTGAVTEDGTLITGLGFARGFDSYSENKSPGIMLPKGQVDQTFAEARSWLKRQRKKRFFLFLHTFQVHAPYAPPERYRNLFPQHPVPVDRRSEDPAEQMALYDREIRYVDDELRTLFRALEEEGLAESTLFVLTSDHGDAFLEHGFWSHGTQLHREITHVPLMFWGPSVPAGRRVPQPVGHVDLMPTLLELLRVPSIDSATGRSFAGLLTGTAATHPGKSPPVYSETFFEMGMMAGNRTVFVPQPTYAVRVGDQKLIRHQFENRVSYESYDLDVDPGEQKDRFREKRSEVRHLKALIDAYPGEANNLREALLQKEREAGQPADQELPFDPERDAKLRALGYLE